MKIIVGLGNPGKKYQNTRHNVGFLAVDEFARRNNFPGFKMSKKFEALILEEIFNGEKIILAKPQIFMNNSGRAVRKIISNSKLQIANLIVVHDDIDLPLGSIKIVQNRGSAGHKGVESVIKELGKRDFIRLRIGIKPKQFRALSYGAEKFVLRQFTKKEEKIIKGIIEKSVLALETLIKEGVEKAMNDYNQ